MGKLVPTGQDWSDAEIDLIVTDYFDMLSLEMAGSSYVKADRNRAIQELTGRSRGSIEFKHQNISAVLLQLGLPWIYGYKPMANFQNALIDGIERYLDQRGGMPNFLLFTSQTPSARSIGGMQDASTLFYDAPPPRTLKDEGVPASLSRLVRRFDPAARDARNRSMGRHGEERVLTHEQARLNQAGQFDLAKKVRWVSEEDGDGAGYDILSYSHDGRERCLEVKTTVGHQTTPFYLSENERAFSAERPEAFRIVRLYDFARTPRAFELAPPLDACLFLNPTNYRASFV